MSSYKKRGVSDAGRRYACIAAGAAVGKVTPITCPLCGAAGEVDWRGTPGWPLYSPFEVDHIQPERHGGGCDPDNVRLLCRSCNRRKGARLP